MRSHEPFVEARDVSLSYPGRAVLRSVDFSVMPGELVSILGPSGSGKSTGIVNLLAAVRPNTQYVRKANLCGKALQHRGTVRRSDRDPCAPPHSF
jgi:ABC-type transporter Mla maintaining outer membrane lipid asymmetry ATPase subunit MlaF